MPLVFAEAGFRFFFYSNEGDPLEPVHIHVRRERCLAKFWLFPEPSLANSHGFSAKELNNILRIINNRRAEIEEAWNEHFGI